MNFKTVIVLTAMVLLGYLSRQCSSFDIVLPGVLNDRYFGIGIVFSHCSGPCTGLFLNGLKGIQQGCFTKS